MTISGSAPDDNPQQSLLSKIAALFRRPAAKPVQICDVWLIDREGVVYKPTRQVELRARAKTE